MVWTVQRKPRPQTTETPSSGRSAELSSQEPAQGQPQLQADAWTLPSGPHGGPGVGGTRGLTSKCPDLRAAGRSCCSPKWRPLPAGRGVFVPREACWDWTHELGSEQGLSCVLIWEETREKEARNRKKVEMMASEVSRGRGARICQDPLRDTRISLQNCLPGGLMHGLHHPWLRGSPRRRGQGPEAAGK